MARRLPSGAARRSAVARPNHASLEPQLGDSIMTLSGRTVLITGGTGSFGQMFVRTVLRDHDPARVIVYSRDELKQYEMRQRFPEPVYGNLTYVIGDVRDRDRLSRAMAGVDV